MKVQYIALFLLVNLICATSKSSQSKNENHSEDNTSSSQEVKMLNDQAFLLETYATDETYGYSEKNPIKVGGVNFQQGPLNERRFLNGLKGPEGQAITYTRRGSCCPFKTPNGFSGTGMLDIYVISWEGGGEKNLYLNMYDYGTLLVPMGFKSKAE